MLGEELLDVVAVDRQPALEAEVVADRGDAAEAPEPDASDRRPLREPSPGRTWPAPKRWEHPHCANTMRWP